jgi:hypothetical protein
MDFLLKNVQNLGSIVPHRPFENREALIPFAEKKPWGMLIPKYCGCSVYGEHPRPNYCGCFSTGAPTVVAPLLIDD